MVSRMNAVFHSWLSLTVLIPKNTKIIDSEPLLSTFKPHLTVVSEVLDMFSAT